MSETEPKVDIIENPESSAAAPKVKKVKEPKVKKVNSQLNAVPDREQWKISGLDEREYGDLPLMNSSFKTERVFHEVAALNGARAGEQVWVRARVHTVRGKGKTCFIQLRRGLATMQLVMCAFGNEGEPSVDLVKYAAKIPAEATIDVFGTVVKPDNDVESCTQKDVEIQVQRIYVVSNSIPLPFQLADANRYDPLDMGDDNEENHDLTEEVKGAEGNVRVLQQSRLDNRWVDLRTFANQAIFRLQSKVGQYFRQYFLEQDYTEIHTPKIIPGVSEGGSNVFHLDYFGRKCCLAQSPQLYKQMAVTSDLYRVFEIGPVFRAENSNTHRHMCEFMGLDFEMEIKEHYHEVLKMLSGVFVYIFDQINANCATELAAVNAQYPFSPLKYNKDVLTMTFKQARQILVDAGETSLGEFDDLSTPQEKHLGRLIKEKYDIDLYIVDKYPSAIRPFYTMPCPEDPNYSNSYDVFLRGEEITSGAQRIHDSALLTKRAAECGIPADNVTDYVKSFQYGAYPHGGAGIGLERVVMLFLGLNNIRKTSMFPRVPNRASP